MKYWFLLPVFGWTATLLAAQPVTSWKAGFARARITPNDSLWMGGYAARTHASEGTMHDLWVKAMALEDASGNRAVLVTADLSGISKPISDRIRTELQKSLGLTRAQVMLNVSHTHSGPVLEKYLYELYPLAEHHRSSIHVYTEKLVQNYVQVVQQAFQNLRSARLSVQQGTVRFQVNRRNNVESQLTNLSELRGPNDYSVPVIRVANPDGTLRAVVFGYACHPTVLSGYRWSGDYPGFAQLELEKSHPGVQALFVQGAGADQNPLPRRTEALARQYGFELVAAVERVLAEPMTDLSAELRTTYSEIELAFGTLPTEEELKKLSAGPAGFQKNWADRQLKQRAGGQAASHSYPYPIQVWKLGNQCLIGLGGEPTVEYAIQSKKLLGITTMVLGYCNDVMAYIPSATVLREGGYEGYSSQMAFGLPGPWRDDLQNRILEEIVNRARAIGVVVP